MDAADALVLVTGFLAFLAIVAWVIGPDDRKVDARRRNPRATAPDPWWRA